MLKASDGEEQWGVDHARRWRDGVHVGGCLDEAAKDAQACGVGDEE